MKYLKTVILENFQSHKYSTIELDKGLNVIVGPSDTGKSAIIRAIKWALYNEPSGDYFIRKGETDVTVTLIFSDGTKIKRYRSRSKNQYILYDNLGEEIKYEGFGLAVPEEIVEKIGIEKIYLDSDETNSINLGEQLEGPFLLSEKTSTRASAIGRLIGVNIIDDALKDTLKDLRNDSLGMREKNNKVSALEEELETFKYLDGLKVKLDRLEILQKSIQDKYRTKDILHKLQNKYIDMKREMIDLKIYLEKLDIVDELELKAKEISDFYRNYKYFNIKNGNYKYCMDEINNNKIIIDKLKGTDRLWEIQSNLYDNIKLLTRFSKLNLAYKSSVSYKNKLEGSLLKLKNIEKIGNNIDNSNKKIEYLNKLTLLKHNYEANQNSIKIGKDYTLKFENLVQIDLNYNLLYKNIAKLELLLEKKKEMNLYNKRYSDEKEKYKEIVSQIDENLKDYKKLLTKQEVCPLCLSAIDNDKVNHIMEHLS